MFDGQTPPSPPVLIHSKIDYCVVKAAKKYRIWPSLIYAIMKVESSGRPGAINKNKNGSFDAGLMQINSIWGAYFKKYGGDMNIIYKDYCSNIEAGTYILKKYNIRMRGDWLKTIAAYNAGPGKWEKGLKYAKKVLKVWKRFEKKPAISYLILFTDQGDR